MLLLIKNNLICFYIIAVFYNKIRNHLWNPHDRKSVSPEQTKSFNMYSQKGLFYTSYSTSSGKLKKKKKQHKEQPNHKIILSLPFLASNKFTPLSQEANPSNKYQRELRGAGMPGGAGEGGLRRSSSSCVQCLRGAVVPRGSVQGDDVGRAAAAAGDDAGLGPARGANVRAALVVAGGGDDAARRAAC